MYRYYKTMRPNNRGLNEMVHNRAFIEPGVISGGPNRDGAWIAIRFYAPTQEVIDLKYEIPGIERIEE
jgi:hypothetical protein